MDGEVWARRAYSARATARRCGYQSNSALKAKEVEIFRRGDEVVLRERDKTLARAFDLLASLPDDFDLPGRENERPKKRKGI